MNKVILTGRLTRDPEQRMTSSTLEISRYSLACTADFSTKDGEREVEFINCVSFNRTASTINKYCKKGTLISAIGRIKNGSYEKDGIKRYTTEVIVDQIELLSSKPAGTNSENNSYNNSNDNNYSSYTNNSNNVETTDISEDPYKNFGEQVALSSDDLPF